MLNHLSHKWCEVLYLRSPFNQLNWKRLFTTYYNITQIFILYLIVLPYFLSVRVVIFTQLLYKYIHTYMHAFPPQSHLNCISFSYLSTLLYLCHILLCVRLFTDEDPKIACWIQNWLLQKLNLQPLIYETVSLNPLGAFAGDVMGWCRVLTHAKYLLCSLSPNPTQMSIRAQLKRYYTSICLLLQGSSDSSELRSPSLSASIKLST